MRINILLALLLGFNVVACSPNDQKQVTNSVYVTIDYGNNQVLEGELVFQEHMTALEALQRMAEVETKPVGAYVFVSRIDSITNKKNVNAWYYLVNGEGAKVLAIDYELQAGDTMTWINKKDLCSHKD